MIILIFDNKHMARLIHICGGVHSRIVTYLQSDYCTALRLN